MNSDTKKKIEVACHKTVITEAGIYRMPNANFREGARFGYQLALKDAAVLVEALEKVTPHHTNNCHCGFCDTLKQWRKVTE